MNSTRPEERHRYDNELFVSTSIPKDSEPERREAQSIKVCKDDEKIDGSPKPGHNETSNEFPCKDRTRQRKKEFVSQTTSLAFLLEQQPKRWCVFVAPFVFKVKFQHRNEHNRGSKQLENVPQQSRRSSDIFSRQSSKVVFLDARKERGSQ